ncbi:hypothetical protein [Trichloromonas sp.]|jgi:hypothetical protein|uniref:hypothetical protein n=1 Tax=Trichloromonas sp. TaxID=3069249 RepID=UPI002A45F5D5|nr:hypothetical protein [Trichloromonas sp.]
MKKYKKNKFWFLWDNGIKKEPKDGENYYRFEWKLKSKFPFVFKEVVCYTLINDVWVEQHQLNTCSVTKTFIREGKEMSNNKIVDTPKPIVRSAPQSPHKNVN